MSNKTPLFDVFTNKFSEDIFKQKYSMNGLESWEDTAKRVVSSVCGQLLNKIDQEKILNLIIERKFIPAGRYLYSAGRPFHAVNNCYLFRVEDSREGWADAVSKATASLMTGGGIGFDYSALRAEGEIIKKTGGKSTGPIALMNMVNEIGRYVMQGGQRRCLPEGTKVHARKGLIDIEKLNIGDEVLTTKGYKKVTGKVHQGVQKTVKIITQNGNIECTPNHRIAVLTDIRGNYKWIEAQNLNEGDRLYFNNNMIEGKKTKLPENNFVASDKAYSLKRITIPELTPEIAWLIGLLHGDGYIKLKNDNGIGKRHGRVQIACSKDYPGIKDKAVDCLSKFGINVSVKDGDGDLWNVTVSSVELADYLTHLKKPNEEITIPSYITEGTADIRAAYIAGLMDADGCSKNRPIIIASQIYPKYLQQVQELCSSLGIATRLKLTRNAIGNWKSLYALSVSTGKQLRLFKKIIGEFGHKCDFYIPEGSQQFSYSFPNCMVNSENVIKYRKFGVNTSIEKIESVIGELPFTPVKVMDIQDGEEVDTWDIEVSDVPEFFVNGYLVHNSAIFGSLNWKHKDVFKFMDLKNHSPELKAAKENDFNFPLPMELTNISVNYDTEFFIAIEDENHLLHNHAKEVFEYNCRQAFKTAEPGFSFNYLKDNETLRNACCEVVSEDDSDKCNLGTLWINRFKDKKEFAEAVKYSTLFLLCGGIYSDVPTEKIKQVGNKNNRIGLGLGGIHEWLIMNEGEYKCTPELHKWLRVYEQESDSAAFIYSKLLGVSIPKGKRAIAPTGTIGIIAETTTGIEPLFCKAYQRRYFKDGKWLTQYVVDGTVKRLLDKNISLDNIKDSYDLTFKERVKLQADIQNYVDMAISSTCNITAWGSEDNNEKTLKDNMKTLLKYAKRLRGFTVYPDGCRGGQPLNRVDLEEALKNEGVVFEENETNCVNGVCGI